MDGTLDMAQLGATTRWFEDFALGERFTLPHRTMNDAVFSCFLEASGETHPLHSSAGYCQAQGMPGVMAHGFQVLIQTAAGAGTFHDMIGESLIALTEQSSRFVRPVYAGDTLHPVLQVVELAPNNSTGVVSLRSTIHNQKRELVLDGTQKYLLRKQPG